MKKACTFTLATTHYGFLRVSCKHFCLNKPGRACFSPYGGTGVASQPPIGHYFFSPFTATLHHAHTQTSPIRSGNPITRRKADHPTAFSAGRSRYVARFDAIIQRTPGPSAYLERQARTAPAEVKTADYPSIFSTQFINLQQVNTL